MAKKSKVKLKKKALLLGLGFDNNDGHTRVTTGENFKLFGGSEDTHGTMTEKAIKLNERLKRRGKTLDTISREEFHEIVHEVGMRMLNPDRPRSKKSG